MLHCTGDVSLGRRGDEKQLQGTVLFRFRSSLIRAWTVERGLLLLHHTGPPVRVVKVAAFDFSWNEKSPPSEPRGILWLDAPVEPQPAGWALVRVPGEALRPLVADETRGLLVRLPRKWRVSSRDSLQNVPYMFAEGTPPSSR
jgi:hypothetical protein